MSCNDRMISDYNRSYGDPSRSTDPMNSNLWRPWDAATPFTTTTP